MGWDPETGMWTPDVTRQPFGAMSAVMNLMNATRAHDISSELEANRQFQLQEAQQKAAEEGERFGWERNAREAMMGLPPDATPEQASMAYLRSGGDARGVLPFLRTQESLAGRKTLRDMQNASQELQKYTSLAGDPEKGKALYKRAHPDATDEEVEMYARMGVAPKPAAETQRAISGANLAESQADLADTRAADIIETQPARVDLMKARTEAERTLKEYRLKRSVPGAIFGPKERANVIEKIVQNRKIIEAIESKRDPLSYKLGAVDQANLQALKDANQQLEDLLEQQPSGPSAAAPQGAPAAAPAPAGGDPSDPLGYFSKKP